MLKISYDTEAELAVFNIANLLGVDTCPVYRIDHNHTFSEFRYDFLKESIIHMRHAIPDYNPSEELYPQIINAFPHIKYDVIKMLILDFVTAQDDRHMSNLAMCGDKLYPLYDNGWSLFWEDDDDFIRQALSNVKLYSKSFGPVGTYYDILLQLSREGIKFNKLVNLDLTEEQILNVLTGLGYSEERTHLLAKWVFLCVQELKYLDLQN